MKRKLLQLMTSLLLPIMGHAPSVAAQSLHEYYVISAPLTDLLLLIGRDANLEIEFDSEQQIYVTSTHLSGTGIELMTQLTSQYGLSHFVFNGTAYVGLMSDQQARIMRSEDYEMAEVLAALEKSGLGLMSYNVTAITNPNAFILTAPPRMLAIAETIIESMPRKGTASAGRNIIVRRGVTIEEAKTE